MQTFIAWKENKSFPSGNGLQIQKQLKQIKIRMIVLTLDLSLETTAILFYSVNSVISYDFNWGKTVS